MAKKKKKDENKKEQDTNYAIGMCLGVAFGSIVGAVTNNMGLWLPMGLCFGVCFGSIITDSKK